MNQDIIDIVMGAEGWPAPELPEGSLFRFASESAAAATGRELRRQLGRGVKFMVLNGPILVVVDERSNNGT